MKACVLRLPAAVETNPLEFRDVPAPLPQQGEVLVRVRACGVCRTDLHVFDGELPKPVPWIVTVVPPDVDPLPGDTPVTVGCAV